MVKGYSFQGGRCNGCAGLPIRENVQTDVNMGDIVADVNDSGPIVGKVGAALDSDENMIVDAA